MATTNGTGEPLPDGIFSLLDTDLYKLTMQCAILKYFPKVDVSYKFTNRTSEMKLNRAAFNWLQKQIAQLAHISVSEEEIQWLSKTCDYFSKEYLEFLKTFRLHPDSQVELSFTPVDSGSSESDGQPGDVSLYVKGLWLDTILYEIPLLALISEAYFKFVDTDWDHEGQVKRAYQKGMKLLENGCAFSEFGSRRRRDYKTHDLVIQGLQAAQEEGRKRNFAGKWTGTSNVHFAMKYGVAPVGTVAHEWFMGIAAVTNDYSKANETALQYWTGTFGRGILSIALTDTFGTPNFLEAFKKPAPPSMHLNPHDDEPPPNPSYAEVFTGVRQDSGDPYDFIKMMRSFYDAQNIHSGKVIVFSDSLNVEKCIEYMHATQEAHLTPSFGVGTFLTNDFVKKSSGGKSVPLNIVIKLNEAAGRPCIKISDNLGKNTGDAELVRRVKETLGYTEKTWEGGNEKTRWGTEEDSEVRGQESA